MKYSFNTELQLVLLTLVLIAVSYIFKLVRDKTQTYKEVKEGFESRIDPVVPNQLRYWGERKKGIVQEYDGDKFLELDAQGDLKLTSRDETYKKYLGKGLNPNYHGPLKVDGEYVAVDGHNIGVLNNIELEDCKNRCDKLDNCQGVTYKESEKKCALEEHSCANAPKDCVPSKWRAYEKLETNDRLIEADKVQADFGEAQHDITIIGNNVGHIKSTSLKNCLNTCHKNPRCAAASFRRGECFHEGKTCKEAGKACVRGDKAKGWQMFELSNTSSKGGTKNQYYPVRIGGKRAAISGYNLKKFTTHSIDKCTAECDKAGSKCRGVEYKGNKCTLSSAICRSVGSKCKNYKSVDAYEKIKYLGPYFIKTRWNYGSKSYLAMKQSKSRGVPLIMTDKTDEYSKWIMHPDGSIQNVGTELFISYSGSLNPGVKIVSGISRRRWIVDKSEDRSWKPTHWAGLIYYMANKKYFMYVNRNFTITMEVESKSGRRKNPNYTTCETQSGIKSSSGSKYLQTGKTVDKTHWQAQWSLVKTSY